MQSVFTAVTCSSLKIEQGARGVRVGSGKRVQNSPPSIEMREFTKKAEAMSQDFSPLGDFFFLDVGLGQKALGGSRPFSTDHFQPGRDEHAKPCRSGEMHGIFINPISIPTCIILSEICHILLFLPNKQVVISLSKL